VLELRGDTGSFLAAIVRQHPGVEATPFALPAVAATVRERLRGTAQGGRCRVVEGDFVSDPSLRATTPEHSSGGSRAATGDGARLLLVDFWTPTPPTRGLRSRPRWREFLLTPGGGDVNSVEEARQWLRESGWRPVEHTPLDGPASLVLAEAV